jgi:hypothetical protein
MNCPKCGKEIVSSVHQCNPLDSLNYCWSYIKKEHGWICPICGCAMAPWMYTCKIDHSKLDFKINDSSDKP